MTARAAPTTPQPTPAQQHASAPIDFDTAAKNGTPVTIDTRAAEWSSNAGAFASPISQKLLAYGALGFGLGLIALNITKPYDSEDKKFVIDPEFVKLRSQVPSGQADKVQLSYADMKALTDYEAQSTQYQLQQKLPQARAKHDEYLDELRREQEQLEREKVAKALV